jgi:hypothetical protein
MSTFAFGFFFSCYFSMPALFARPKKDYLICRLSSFAVVFLLQFLLLSFCFGIPLFVLFCSLGQYLGSGLIDMWRISPIFQVCTLSCSDF